MTQDARPLSDEQIDHLFETHVGMPSPSLPWVKTDFFNFARAVESAVASQRAPLIQPEPFPYEPPEPSDEARRAWKAHYGPEINTADANRSFAEFFAGWYAARQPRALAAPLAPTQESGETDPWKRDWKDVHPAQSPAGPSSAEMPNTAAPAALPSAEAE